MIDEGESDAKEHLSDTENDGKLHFKRVGERDAVLSDIPDWIYAIRVGTREVVGVRVEHHRGPACD